MKKSLIKERVGKIKQCPNCEATEEYGKFELITYINTDKDNTIVEEECPSCGAHIIFSGNEQPRCISIEELLEVNNDFRKILMFCPDLNGMVRNYLSEQENIKTVNNSIEI